MKKFFLLFIYVGTLFGFEQTSNITLEYANYTNYKNETVLLGDTKVKFSNNYFNTNITLDYMYSLAYKDKRYFDINELYFTKDVGDYSFTFGKSIKFLGELEGFNLTDIYNQRNNLKNPFDDKIKLGSFGLDITKYFDDDYIQIGVKLYEQDLEFLKNTEPYSVLKINYDKSLQTKHTKYTPSLYFLYNFATDESENKIIIYHGYDNKRYFTFKDAITLQQYAYEVNKLLFTSHLIHNDIIYKLELAYTDVINDAFVSDYTQFGIGFENNFYDINEKDLSLYMEYYRYIYENNSKIKYVDISELYDNDIFLALKLNFNDVKNTELKGGILFDADTKEKIYKIELKTRVNDTYLIKTQLSSIDNIKKVSFNITYSF